jgi:hypothetical protein
MIDLYASYSRNRKGQLKVQQMAFVLVALMIFFAIALLFYISIRSGGIVREVESLREEEVIESVRKMAGTAEFSWTASGDCAACIDLDKVFMLKDRAAYKGFWSNIELLQVKRVYPTYSENECERENYPNCDTITIIDGGGDLRGLGAFVALCRYDPVEGREKCELGKIIMAYEPISA